MEFFNIITNIGLVLVILFFFYFLYTLQVLATKKTVTFIKAKCPDYWEYNNETNMCSHPTDTDLSIDLSEYPNNCDKYNYSRINNIAWSGISNNYNLIEKCKM